MALQDAGIPVNKDKNLPLEVDVIVGTTMGECQAIESADDAECSLIPAGVATVFAVHFSRAGQ